MLPQTTFIKPELWDKNKQKGCMYTGCVTQIVYYAVVFARAVEMG